jgi:hypothetical protein
MFHGWRLQRVERKRHPPASSFSPIEAQAPTRRSLGISFKNLWRGRCQRIVGAGHTPFLQKPTVFNDMLSEYLAELAYDQ